jgi:hypothetical protein
MSCPHKTKYFARPVCLAANLSVLSFVGLSFIDPALASRGPGVGPGTASGFMQMAMAILVYGAAALVIGTGLIGALRRH